ncbi:hypothetical protein M408DRAFT_20532 [Serendipita vermifera MAFF 305830]|uniref:Thioredoxin domain-containing protein n=1 Tax=Serendipita vermifera MAFF 305830 TaxID=933852 RepID=A0A0C3BJF3_SERVB|nr:hypothetical protein M408DRAFT_20532 [Serendipita vermifera MAFF 305830]
MTQQLQVSPSDTFDQSTIEKAAKVLVWSENGDSVTFGSLFEKQKTIVVFIRHFLCGACKTYVEELAKVPKSALDAAGTRIVVGGCGDWPVIKLYREHTGFTSEIYAEPTRTLHRILELGATMRVSGGAPIRRYAPNLFFTTVKSFGTQRLLANLSLYPKIGDTAQRGGDFVCGPGLDITYGRRMVNNVDHIDVPELMQVAGVAYTGDEDAQAAS